MRTEEDGQEMDKEDMKTDTLDGQEEQAVRNTYSHCHHRCSKKQEDRILDQGQIYILVDSLQYSKLFLLFKFRAHLFLSIRYWLKNKLSGWFHFLRWNREKLC